MDDLNASAFASLFKDAYLKCFGHPLINALTETESKLFCNQILDQTGLVIGWKSIKNYSFYIVNDSPGKRENPSIATLDTLSRYVLNAPYTDEIQRKNRENHYPYWFKYKDQFHRTGKKTSRKKSLLISIILVSGLAITIGLLIFLRSFKTAKSPRFTDDFTSVADDSLTSRGWFVQSKDADYWNRRSEKPGYLALFTLRGDNWPASSDKPGIKNLLLRKITSDCFTAELHLKNFVPGQNWQQAGIILLEDTGFIGKSVRLSLAYNDFSGGDRKLKEILIQSITSLGKDFHQPEEIAHKPVLYLDSVKENPALLSNLQTTALRIEKQGKKFRLLYANGSMENSAFREAVSQEFDMHPRYIGIFSPEGIC